MRKQEDAYFAALLVIAKTAVEAGMDRLVLADRLRKLAASARADHCQSKAAALEIVAQSVDPNRVRSPKTSTV
jgi:hypothetical protein